jgi:Peptidase family M23
LPDRGVLAVFNPFYQFNRQVPIHRMHYEFFFDSAADNPIQTSCQSIIGSKPSWTFYPIVYHDKTDLEDEFEGHRVKHLGAVEHKGLGNHVIIDHGHGEHSLLRHVKSGSVRVKAGDTVKQGDLLGQIGFSGDAIFPHLQYTLMAGPGRIWGRGRGLPSYFRNFQRLLGSKTEKVPLGRIDSGDIVRSF